MREHRLRFGKQDAEERRQQEVASKIFCGIVGVFFILILVAGMILANNIG